jgi:hypothetical protein
MMAPLASNGMQRANQAATRGSCHAWKLPARCVEAWNQSCNAQPIMLEAPQSNHIRSMEPIMQRAVPRNAPCHATRRATQRAVPRNAPCHATRRATPRATHHAMAHGLQSTRGRPCRHASRAPWPIWQSVPPSATARHRVPARPRRTASRQGYQQRPQRTASRQGYQQRPRWTASRQGYQQRPRRTGRAAIRDCPSPCPTTDSHGTRRAGHGLSRSPCRDASCMTRSQ